jgi:hypothetical protein
MNDEIEGFMMNADTAEEYFKRCIIKSAKTEEERVAILRELQKELRVVRMNETDLVRRLRNSKIVRIKQGDTNPHD